MKATFASDIGTDPEGTLNVGFDTENGDIICSLEEDGRENLSVGRNNPTCLPRDNLAFEYDTVADSESENSSAGVIEKQTSGGGPIIGCRSQTPHDDDSNEHSTEFGASEHKIHLPPSNDQHGQSSTHLGGIAVQHIDSSKDKQNDEITQFWKPNYTKDPNSNAIGLCVVNLVTENVEEYLTEFSVDGSKVQAVVVDGQAQSSSDFTNDAQEGVDGHKNDECGICSKSSCYFLCILV
jgi:hypothetical protein